MSLKSSTSRIWLVAMTGVLILGTGCAPTGPVLTIESAVSSLQVNNTAHWSVNVENITALTAYETHLSFDPNVLEVTELIDGGFIQPDFVVQNTFDNAAGTIDYAVAQINRPPANGDGILFEIVFRAKTPGQSTIRFREMPAAPTGAILADRDGTAIAVSLTEGDASVSGP